jgi:hypothetical protein
MKPVSQLVLWALVTALFQTGLVAQPDPLEELEAGLETTKDFQMNTFGSTRVINAHSSETQPKNSLDFRISHRFGTLNDGAYGFFGLDRASMRLSFEYGVTDRLLVGVGRSTIEKTYDGFLKYKLLWQAKGPKASPVTLTYLVSMTTNTLKYESDPQASALVNRLAYVHQAIIARKFNKAFSLELLPTYVHRNLVDVPDQNDVWALGAAARVRFNTMFALDAEYFYVFPGYVAEHFINSFSIGLDVKTGGHEFQLAFTNSLPMIEKGFIAQTTDRWDKGGIHFGFNLSRVFEIGGGRKRKHEK